MDIELMWFWIIGMGLKLVNGFDMDMNEIGFKMDSWINVDLNTE